MSINRTLEACLTPYPHSRVAKTARLSLAHESPSENGSSDSVVCVKTLNDLNVKKKHKRHKDLRGSLSNIKHQENSFLLRINYFLVRSAVQAEYADLTS